MPSFHFNLSTHCLRKHLYCSFDVILNPSTVKSHNSFSLSLSLSLTLSLTLSLSLFLILSISLCLSLSLSLSLPLFLSLFLSLSLSLCHSLSLSLYSLSLSPSFLRCRQCPFRPFEGFWHGISTSWLGVRTAHIEVHAVLCAICWMPPSPFLLLSTPSSLSFFHWPSFFSLVYFFS